MGEIKDKAEGKARELKGKITGDRAEEARGNAQQVKGKVEGAANRVADKTRAEVNDPAHVDRDTVRDTDR